MREGSPGSRKPGEVGVLPDKGVEGEEQAGFFNALLGEGVRHRVIWSTTALYCAGALIYCRYLCVLPATPRHGPEKYPTVCLMERRSVARRR